jgi:hypothetical protein
MKYKGVEISKEIVGKNIDLILAIFMMDDMKNLETSTCNCCKDKRELMERLMSEQLKKQ